MKIVIWLTGGLLTALWTGLALASAALVKFMGKAASSASGNAVGNWVAELDLPAWLSVWVDVGTLQLLINAAAELLRRLNDWGPGLADALSWLVPVIWTVWALGMLLLLALAVGLHLLVGRRPPGPTQPQGA